MGRLPDRMIEIAQNRVKVDHAVKRAAGRDPFALDKERYR